MATTTSNKKEDGFLINLFFGELIAFGVKLNEIVRS